MPLQHRFIKGYPRRAATLVRRYKRDAVNRDRLRQQRPRRHAKSWMYRTSASEDILLEERAFQGVRGSLQERIVYQSLIDHNFIPGYDFTFQSSQLGGRMQLGGLVADFLFPVPMVIVQVQSAWHTMGLQSEIRDSDQALILRSMGYTVLEVWPNVIEDPVALDQWMQQNLMHMWGTSTQRVQGSGNSVEHNWADLANRQLDNVVERLVVKFDQIQRVLSGA